MPWACLLACCLLLVASLQPIYYYVRRTLTRHGCHLKSSCPLSSSSCVAAPLNEGLFALSMGPKSSQWAQNGLISPICASQMV